MAEHSEQNNPLESTGSKFELDNFCKEFAFLDTTTCCHCNGFYGPNFDEPVCGPCHKFIFCSRERRSEWLDALNRPSTFFRYDNGNHVFKGYVESIPASFRTRNGPMVYPSSPRLHPYVRSEPTAQPSTSRIPLQLKDLKKFFNEIEQNENNNETRKERENISVNGNVHIDKLPVEMMSKIFSYLDEEMLFVIRKVSKEWDRIAVSLQEMWKNLTVRRWPLLQRNTESTNWFKMYDALKSSCCCRICADQMIKKADNCARTTVHSRARIDIQNGFEVNGIRLMPLIGKLPHLQASIAGPADSPYEGGIFYLRIHVSDNYPYEPPAIKFLTKIIHPNVSRHGDIGLDIITWKYSSALTLSKLLLSIQSFLCDPFTAVCMEPEVGRLYDNDRRRFDALARHWTRKYAMMHKITFDD